MANPQKEYLEDGYIKLSRLIFRSKTFSSLNAIQKLITIYLILMANYKDKEWWDSYQKKFVTIKRGSFITSIEHIKEKIDDRLVTTKKIRTCLKILEKLQFLAIERASRYSHITIIKYDLYQDDENYRAKQRARQGQDKGKIRAINNNGNNGKNKDKEVGKPPFQAPFKEKKKANNIEYDFEAECWYGLDDDILETWGKKFPMLNIAFELQDKLRGKFRLKPKYYQKLIKEKYKNNYALFIFDWLEGSKKFYLQDHPEYERSIGRNVNHIRNVIKDLNIVKDRGD